MQSGIHGVITPFFGCHKGGWHKGEKGFSTHQRANGTVVVECRDTFGLRLPGLHFHWGGYFGGSGHWCLDLSLFRITVRVTPLDCGSVVVGESFGFFAVVIKLCVFVSTFGVKGF